MTEEGKYIYCIIDTNGVGNFGAIGIGGRGDIVSNISYQDISAVISNYPMGKYELSKENLLAHEEVVERVMSDYTVLPMRAFTIAANAEEVRDFLRKHYRELTGLLKDMDNKVELGLTAYWKDMAPIFQEIVNGNRKIRTLREKIAGVAERQGFKEKINLGEMVASALKYKKEIEGEEILRSLKKSAVDFRMKDVRGDEMIINAAFLIARGWENEFDSKVRELKSKYAERIRFKYVGPVPPYNFVNLRI